ncbi:MAG: enoyl-CoA hydratase-related protein [Candidatus Dormibacteria bacterium]
MAGHEPGAHGGAVGDTSAQPLLIERSGSVTTLVLNRPAQLNAIDRELSLALIEAVRKVAGDDGCRCLVLTGAGRAFCSGQALGSVDDPLPSDIEGFIHERYTPLVLGLQSLPIPVVAGVNGLAAGAGLSLALAADIRIAATSAWFSCAFAQIGLVPDSGATYFLSRYLGMGPALHYALTGERITAERALELGLVTKTLAPEDFHLGIDEFAHDLARGATTALGMTKLALYSGASAGLEDQLALEAKFQQAASETKDFHEGLAAFREKRPPHFTGN